LAQIPFLKSVAFLPQHVKKEEGKGNERQASGKRKKGGCLGAFLTNSSFSFIK